MYDLTLGGSHVVFSDQTRPCPNEAIIRHPAHLTHKKFASHLRFSDPRHAPKAGTDYSPVCFFWLWLLLHPDRLSSGLLHARCPTGYGPARYTWGLLPKPAEACTQPIAPPDGGQRGPHPLHSPLHAHFHEQSLQLITMIVLSTARLSALEWSFCAIWAPECCQWVLMNCAHKPRRTLICEIPCESDHSRKPRSCHGVSNRSLWSSVSRSKSCQDRETRLCAL